MANILLTGANGNVGREVAVQLAARGETVKAGVLTLGERHDGVEQVLFDFGDPTTYEEAFRSVDRLFLLRPPQIADVRKYLFPVIDYAMVRGVRQIVFLSLQGVEFNVFTPHYKVERYLRKIDAPFTFIRPNFYMQNLSTFYRVDIRDRSEIFLPAGRGKTAFVDVRDIGEVAAKVLSEAEHISKAYTLSGPESLDYWEVASILSDALGREIRYADPSVREYVARLRIQGADETFIKVQKMLYFIVRHNFSKSTAGDAVKLLGRTPTSMREFAEAYKKVW